MRRKVMAGIATFGILGALQLVSPSDALACHKNDPHGRGSVGVEVGPVEVCEKL